MAHEPTAGQGSVDAHAPSFRTIVVHVEAAARCPARIDLALRLARANNSHVLGIAPTGVPDVLLSMSGAVPDVVELVGLSARFLRMRADGAIGAFRQQASAAGASAIEGRVVAGDPAEIISGFGRCADLLVVGQEDGSSADALPLQLPPVLFRTGRPLLIMPSVGSADSTGKNVLVAWKDTREAAGAVRDALPLLVRAEKVTLLHVSESVGPGEAGRPPLADVTSWLSRHGVRVTERLDPGSQDVGESIDFQVAAVGADLLVMGGYGHSRFREWMFGGATRHVLERMTVPVLMSH